MSEPVQRALLASADPDGVWLSCAECKRFFQWRDVRDRSSGPYCRCPFADCDGCDLDIDIGLWDADRHAEDLRWPEESELRVGARAPDMASFHSVREGRRRSERVAHFARSEARRAIKHIDEACRIADLYLNALWALVGDPDMDYGFAGLDVIAAAFGPCFAGRSPEWVSDLRAEAVVATMRAYAEFCELELGHDRVGQVSWSMLQAMIEEEIRIGRDQLAARKRVETTRARVQAPLGMRRHRTLSL